MPGLVERLLFRVAKRWIAGYDLEDALRVAREVNKRKIYPIINRLGEHTPDQKLIEEYTQEYFRILDQLESENIDATISIKPSQIGLAAETSLFESNLTKIVQKAQSSKRFVWLDMENSPYTDATLQVYKELLPKYSEFGVCLQANLKRTLKDLEDLLPVGGKIRLVKGAYPENAMIAYKRRKDVDANYTRLMRMLFEQAHWFGIATHDSKLIAEAEQLSEKYNVQFEFQLLKGIRDDLKEKLVDQGFRVSEYIPYGREWYNYSKRRMRERKRNILLLARSMMG